MTRTCTSYTSCKICKKKKGIKIIFIFLNFVSTTSITHVKCVIGVTSVLHSMHLAGGTSGYINVLSSLYVEKFGTGKDCAGLLFRVRGGATDGNGMSTVVKSEP